MDDALFMGDLERVDDLPGDREGFGDRQASASLDPLRERAAVHELENQEPETVRFFEAVDRADVRMIQRGEHARLALEAREARRVAGHRARQDLDGDVAPELGVASAVDLAHAARPEQRLQVISADGSASHGTRGRFREDDPRADRERRLVEEPVGGQRLVQQRFDVTPERLVFGTESGEQRHAFARRPGARRVVQLLDPLPALGRHVLARNAAILAPFPTRASFHRPFPLPRLEDLHEGLHACVGGNVSIA